MFDSGRFVANMMMIVMITMLRSLRHTLYLTCLLLKITFMRCL